MDGLEPPRLAGYEIVRSLGEARSLAHRLPDGLEVELQWLSISTDDVEAIMHFLDRGKIVSELRHPNICRVLEVDVAGDRSYVACELAHGVDAGTLAAAKRALPPSVVSAIAGACAAGLAALHERAVAHGAVAAKNVIVQTSGEIVLAGLSFGEQPDALGDLRALGELVCELHGGPRLDEIGARARAGGFGTAREIADAIGQAERPAPAALVAALAGRRPERRRFLVPTAAAAVALAVVAIITGSLAHHRATSSRLASPDAGPVARAPIVPIVVPVNVPMIVAPPDAGQAIAVTPDAMPRPTPRRRQAATWDPDSPLPPP